MAEDNKHQWLTLAAVLAIAVFSGCSQQQYGVYREASTARPAGWPLARVSRGIVRIKIPIGQGTLEDRGYHTSYEVSTGIVLDAQGTVLTCAHAIRNASSGGILVTPSGSDTSYKATVMEVDEALDLAILSVSMSGLEAVAMRPATAADCGTSVLMAGFPTQKTYLSHYDPMFASGLLGRVDRTVTARTGPSGATLLLEIQGWVGHGFSGGPVVSSTGEIIGMVMLRVEDNGQWGGYTLAVPAQTIRAFVNRTYNYNRTR